MYCSSLLTHWRQLYCSSLLTHRRWLYCSSLLTHRRWLYCSSLLAHRRRLYCSSLLTHRWRLYYGSLLANRRRLTHRRWLYCSDFTTHRRRWYCSVLIILCKQTFWRWLRFIRQSAEFSINSEKAIAIGIRPLIGHDPCNSVNFLFKSQTTSPLHLFRRLCSKFLLRKSEAIYGMCACPSRWLSCRQFKNGGCALALTTVCSNSSTK